jgi:hypothetical protein
MRFTLDNVILDDNTQMTGTFAWTYDAGDFEGGVGQFTSLDIPWTLHDQDDLDVVFDVGSSIEITLAGSVHDDGVDITLFLLQPLTPTTPSSIDLTRSKYDIGGNGFHSGVFVSGTLSPAHSVLSLQATGPGEALVSWEPEVPDYVLQETSSLIPANWVDSPSGSTNHVTVPISGGMKFYRLRKP